MPTASARSTSIADVQPHITFLVCPDRWASVRVGRQVPLDSPRRTSRSRCRMIRPAHAPQKATKTLLPRPYNPHSV